MPFSESVKQEAKKRSNFKCCVCQRTFVEIHHILPQAEGGSDELNNAAPLCGGCHQVYGGNPDLRKQLREMRDHWWQTCTSQINDSSINTKLDKKFTSKLRILECRATLRIHHSPNSSNDVEVLISNDSDTSCDIITMELSSGVFNLETVRISFDREVAYGITGRGNEAPLRLNGGELKRVYFRTQELVDQYKDQLPNAVQLCIKFGGESVIFDLTRDSDRSVYLYKADVEI